MDHAPLMFSIPDDPTGSFEPATLEDLPASLDAKGMELMRLVSTLSASLHPITLAALADAFRLANSYYSNLIEGNNTHPVTIEQAMRGVLPVEQAARDRAAEALSHVEAQKAIEALLPDMTYEAVFSPDFVRRIHFEFYSRIPEPLRVAPPLETGGTPLPVIPGEFRTHFVKVGTHVPPRAERLPEFLAHFRMRYTLPEHTRGARRIAAIACAHHRFAWIHPFSDGNGRVGRLLSHAAFIKADLGGPWLVNRGLARALSEYKAHLAAADMVRQGSSDGRGALSRRELLHFADFFLGCAVEQAQFSSDGLKLPELHLRISNHLTSHENPELREVAPLLAKVLRECLIAGEVPRGEIAALVGVSASTATSLAGLLTTHGLVSSVTPKAPLRIAFPQSLLPIYFPAFVPEQ